jgi:hypothetical protein
MTEDHHINQLSGLLGADHHQGANSFNILDISRAQVASSSRALDLQLRDYGRKANQKKSISRIRGNQRDKWPSFPRFEGQTSTTFQRI